ncbi:MAG: hypothetical protein KGL58_06155, partial [Pseudomonadota bacterium]|nr:hypothetical protein [Pseudomonadota bacterium]
MNELLADYSLIGNPGNFVNIDIVATSIALFDASSKVDGEEATLVINLAKLLDSEKCHIGYRVFLQGKVESREIIHGKDLTWV